VSADEFVTRVLAACDEAALRLAGTPHETQAEWLEGFGDRVRAQWGELFRLTSRKATSMRWLRTSSATSELNATESSDSVQAWHD
jgi:hypothetical protein